MRFVRRVGAGGALDLDRRVIQIEFFLQPRLHALHDHVDLRRVSDHGVQGRHAA
ncbi:hypothetical protein [Methyloceanibacter stevinii]|uniref:hypothetical protein n=1 Tax=Methyloceanibacter stevinii TaxID=1774970 RepID=UPI001FCD8B73|nr:hypothetical protein [Methyloceanibacter stevinii]